MASYQDLSLDAAASLDSSGRRMQVIDRGRGTKLQCGQSNVYVDLELPDDIQASEIPTADIPDSNPHPEQDQFRCGYDLKLYGENAKVQLGPANRMISAHKKVPNRTTAQVPMPQPNTQPIQVSEQEREVDTASAVQEQDVEETNYQCHNTRPIFEDITKLVKGKINNDHPTHDNENNSFMEVNVNGHKYVKGSSKFQQPVTAQSPITPLLNDMTHMLESNSGQEANMYRCKDPDVYPTRENPHMQINEYATVVNEISTETLSTIQEACQSLDEKKELLLQNHVQFREVSGNYVPESSSNIVDICINNNFLKVLEAERGLTDTDAKEAIISLKWTGPNDNGYISMETRWTITVPQFLKELLTKITCDVFAPLRNFVAEILVEYNTELQSVAFVDDSLVFVFWHWDEKSAQRMSESRSLVKVAIHKMFFGADKSNVDLKMSVSHNPRKREDVKPHPPVHRTREDLTQNVGMPWNPERILPTMVPVPKEEYLKSSSDAKGRLLLMERKLDEFMDATRTNFEAIRTHMKWLVEECENKESVELEEEQQVLIPELQRSSPQSASINSNQSRDDLIGGFPAQGMSILELQEYAYSGKVQISDPNLASTYLKKEVTNETHANIPITSTQTPWEGGTNIIRREDVKSLCKHEPELSSDISVGCKRSITIPSKKTSTIWQWQDDDGTWKYYDNEQSEKLSMEYDTRPNGTCLLQKDGKSFRVMFKGQMEERSLNSTPRSKCKVRRLVASDLKCDDPSLVEPATDESATPRQ